MKALPKASFGTPVQVLDGEIHRYHVRKDGRYIGFTVCCDCSLVHLEEFTPRKGYIKVRVWRDYKRTKEMRKRKRKTK
jgi:hypothetical protein